MRFCECDLKKGTQFRPTNHSEGPGLLLGMTKLPTGAETELCLVKMSCFDALGKSVTPVFKY